MLWPRPTDPALRSGTGHEKAQPPAQLSSRKAFWLRGLHSGASPGLPTGPPGPPHLQRLCPAPRLPFPRPGQGAHVLARPRRQHTGPQLRGAVLASSSQRHRKGEEKRLRCSPRVPSLSPLGRSLSRTHSLHNGCQLPRASPRTWPTLGPDKTLSTRQCYSLNLGVTRLIPKRGSGCLLPDYSSSLHGPGSSF